MRLRLPLLAGLLAAVLGVSPAFAAPVSSYPTAATLTGTETTLGAQAGSVVNIQIPQISTYVIGQLNSNGLTLPSLKLSGVTGSVQCLQADSAGNVSGFGSGCGSGGSGAISSVFGRTGAITSQAGDYSASQITGLTDSATTPQAWTALSLAHLATTADLSTVSAANVVLSGDGSQVISSLGTLASGIVRELRFTSTMDFLIGTNILGPNAPSRGGSKIIVAAGDTMLVSSLGSGQWQILDYARNSNEGHILWPDPGQNFFQLPPIDLVYWGVPSPATAYLPYYPAAFGAGSLWTGGIKLMSPGDTPSIELRQADQETDGSGKPWASAPYLGAHISGRAVISDQNGHDSVLQPTDPLYTGYGPSYLYQGFTANIDFPIVQTPTRSGTGGALVFKVTPDGAVTPFQRGWFANSGNLVLAGKGAFEACGGTYPYNFTIPPGAGIWQADSPCLDSDYYDTPGWGNLSIVATDKNNGADGNNAAISIREYGSHGTGLDIGYNATTGGIDFDAVNSGTRTTVQSFYPSSSIATKPTNPGFLARLSSDGASQTGDGTTITLVFSAAITNTGSDYSTSTGKFTAPIAGFYHFDAAVTGNNAMGHTSVLIYLVANSASLVKTAAPAGDGSGYFSVSISSDVYMNAGDQAYIQYGVGGGSKNVGTLHNVGGSAFSSWFSGHLVG